jgi:hypothetical protein
MNKIIPILVSMLVMLTACAQVKLEESDSYDRVVKLSEGSYVNIDVPVKESGNLSIKIDNSDGKCKVNVFVYTEDGLNVAQSISFYVEDSSIRGIVREMTNLAGERIITVDTEGDGVIDSKNIIDSVE